MHPKLRSMVLLFVAAFSLGGCAEAPSGDGPHDESADEAEVREADLIGPNPTGKPVRHPIVLVHGFNASPARGGFYGVAEALRADGHEVYVAELPPFQSTEERAKHLKKTVDLALTEQGATKVNLLAHSMGGLDSRVLVSAMGYGDRVAVLTTISTPHRGSLVADAVLDVFDRVRAQDEAINAFFQILARTYADLIDDIQARAAFFSLSTRAAAAFDAKHPDDPRVVYQSVAGVSNVAGIANPKDLAACENTYYTRASGKAAYPGKGGTPDKMNVLLKAGAAIVSGGLGELRPNDGVVTVDSAKHGRFLGCVPADHFGEIGDDALKRPNKSTGFSHTRFYRNLAFDLARRGF